MNIHLSPQDRTICRQRERIEELEEEVRQLRERSKILVVRPPLSWGLNATQERMVSAFYRSTDGFVSGDALFIAMGSKAEEADNLIKVQVMFLRKKLKPLGMEIKCRYALGYVMPAESLAILRTAIDRQSHD